MKMNLSQKEKVHEHLKYTPMMMIMRRQRGGFLHLLIKGGRGYLISKHKEYA